MHMTFKLYKKITHICNFSFTTKYDMHIVSHVLHKLCFWSVTDCI